MNKLVAAVFTANIEKIATTGLSFLGELNNILFKENWRVPEGTPKL